MAKFYDSNAYPTAGTIIGNEVFIIYQSGQSRTTDFDAVLESLIHPLIDNLTLDDILDVSITSPVNKDILIYNNGEWINSESGFVSINDIQDVTITDAEIGQMLIWDGSLWVNGNDPELKGYTEIEYNIGSTSGTYTIDLANGNIQRLHVGGVVSIELPSMPSPNQNWHILLKVISNGVNIPSFISSVGSIKWQSGEVPTDLGPNGSMNIFTFTSDFTSSETYATMVWRED